MFCCNFNALFTSTPDPFRPSTTHNFPQIDVNRPETKRKTLPLSATCFIAFRKYRPAFICSYPPITRKKPFSGSRNHKTGRWLYKSKLSIRNSSGRPLTHQRVSTAEPKLLLKMRVYPGLRYKPNWISKLIDSCKKTVKIYLFAFIYWGPLALFKNGNLLPKTQQPRAGTCPFDTYGHLNYTGASSRTRINWRTGSRKAWKAG